MFYRFWQYDSSDFKEYDKNLKTKPQEAKLDNDDEMDLGADFDDFAMFDYMVENSP